MRSRIENTEQKGTAIDNRQLYRSIYYINKCEELIAMNIRELVDYIGLEQGLELCKLCINAQNYTVLAADLSKNKRNPDLDMTVDYDNKIVHLERKNRLAITLYHRLLNDNEVGYYAMPTLSQNMSIEAKIIYTLMYFVRSEATISDLCELQGIELFEYSE